MNRILVLCLLAGAPSALADEYDPSFPTPKPIYPIAQWPEDIVSVPCSAWKKNDLWRWELTGTLDWTNGDVRVPNAAYLYHSPEGRIVERKCAAK